MNVFDGAMILLAIAVALFVTGFVIVIILGSRS